MIKQISIIRVTVFILALFISSIAQATHFRYGHFSWANGITANSVELKIQNAWRLDGYSRSCVRLVTLTLTLTPCTGVLGRPGVGDAVYEDIGRSRLNWGDGSSPVGSIFGGLLYLVTSVDPANNWWFGEAIDPDSLPLASAADTVDTTLNHEYAVAGDYTAFIASCCRILFNAGTNQHINNPGSRYRVETVINAGGTNASPVSVQAPIVICPINAICSFAIPATDSDGETLSFRLATSAEASASFAVFRQPGSPGSGSVNPASIDSASGIYTWDTSGANLASGGRNTLYSTQVIIEDGTSKVALDFMIQLAIPDPSPPVIEPPAGADPICGTTQIVNVGDNITFDIFASDPDVGDDVALNIVGLPSGASMSPMLPISGNPVTSTFSWTPVASQVGSFAASFSATSSGGGFTQCAVTLTVASAALKTCDIDKDNNVDRIDIGLIMAARNTPANGSSDPRDEDGDGFITLLDARQCVLKCDLNNCAAL